jgi:hypothetical protein
MRAPILLWFGVLSLGCALVELVLTIVGFQGLAMRDVSGATRLDRLTWFMAGLDVGIIATGVTVVVVAWMAGRRLGVIGAGLGILVQGLGLLVMHLTFASLLGHLV